jgi:hypothetical protein
MTFWNIGDEEHSDPRYIRAGPGSFELYHKAGSWRMGKCAAGPSQKYRSSGSSLTSG